MLKPMLQLTGNLKTFSQDKVEEWMSPNPCSFPVSGRVREAADLIMTSGVSCLPVITEEGKVAGLLTKSRIINSLMSNRPEELTLTEIMISPVISLQVNDPLEKVLNYPYKRFPVINEDGKLVGILTQTDFTHAYLEQMGKLNQAEHSARTLSFILENAYETREKSIPRLFDEIIGHSEEITSLKRLGRRIARTRSTVLITGESGTGKEVFAQAIHYTSAFAHGPFVSVNCAAIPEHLLEAELFGYEEGAFTGARKGGKPGKFELANDGTLFLDEIGDMPLSMQSKLLRVLEERKVERVGGVKKYLPQLSL